MKVQHKFLLLLFGFFITLIVIYSAVIYYSVSNYSYEDFYKRLEIRAITTAKINLDTTSGNTIALKELQSKYLERLSDEKHYIFTYKGNRTIREEALEIGVPEHFLREIVEEKSATHNHGNLYMSGILYGHSVVVVSATNYYNSNYIKYLRGVILASVVFLLLFTFLFSLLFSRRIFRPIAKITNSVNAISTENLHHRLEVKDQPDELSELARTFNTMLDRLETSFETQNNFISNASHELGTPLTSIIGVADVVLSKPRSQEEYIDALRVIAEEAEKLDLKTKALLFLAQTGFNGKTMESSEVRIDQLVLDVISTVMKLYPTARIAMDMDLLPENPEKLTLTGNEQLLHLALSNVVSNACKYSGNKVVRLVIGVSDANILLVIKDDGIGIPESELTYIYDPFFRASNTRSFEGYGIGLPLTRNIIKMHHGEITVYSEEHRGTTVKIRLPTHG